MSLIIIPKESGIISSITWGDKFGQGVIYFNKAEIKVLHKGFEHDPT